MSERLLAHCDDVEYTRVDGHPLIARTYQPAGSGPHVGLIEVHGGAWNGLSHLSDEALNRSLAERGIFVASIEFRQPPQGRFPVSIRDVTSAVDWLDANRERFGIGDRIGLLGNSSGGHQALLAAMRPGDPRFTDRALAAAAKVDLVVLCWAVIDPVARYEWALGTGNRPELVTKHLDYWGDVETMRSGSPQHLLDTGTFGHLPRVLAIQGEDDANLPSDMLPRFARSYANVGGLIQVELIANRGHNFVIRDPQDVESQRSINLIAEFVQSGGRPL